MAFLIKADSIWWWCEMRLEGGRSVDGILSIWYVVKGKKHTMNHQRYCYTHFQEFMIVHNGSIVLNSSAAQQSSFSEAVFKCNSNISLKGKVYTMIHWNIFHTYILFKKHSNQCRTISLAWNSRKQSWIMHTDSWLYRLKYGVSFIISSISFALGSCRFTPAFTCT